MQPAEFINQAFAAAVAGAHPFPGYASCEAALESGWGLSRLASKYNNLFGQKASHSHPLTYPVIEMGTWEWVSGINVPEPAYWYIFPDWATAFKERIELVRRLALMTDSQSRLIFPHYQNALNASNGDVWVREVSQNWSTDPERPMKVLEIHNSHKDLLAQLTEANETQGA